MKSCVLHLKFWKHQTFVKKKPANQRNLSWAFVTQYQRRFNLNFASTNFVSPVQSKDNYFEGFGDKHEDVRKLMWSMISKQ